MYTAYVRQPSGLEIYAKKLPLDLGTWTNDIVHLSENGNSGSYSASTFEDGESYEVYENVDGTQGNEASTDPYLGAIYPPASSSVDLSPVTDQLARIPQSATALTPGAATRHQMTKFTDKDDVEITLEPGT